MMSGLRLWLSLVFAVGLAVGAAPQRASAPSPADATSRIVTAARQVLASLDDAGKAKVQYAFDDMAQKKRWSNFPSPMFQREGLRLGDVTPAQRTAVMNLLQAALSADGYRK